MLNFTKKHSNTPVDLNEQAAGASGKYDSAIKRIERLEGELNQKAHELNQIYKAQSLMNDSAKNCAASLYAAKNQLQAVAGYLDRSNKHISELTKENIALKSSGDEWFRRTIKLEFEVLTAKDELKKIENERDLAIKMYDLLQTELITSDKENNRGRKLD